MTVDCDKNKDSLLIDSETSEEHARANTSKLTQIKRIDYLVELIDRLINRYEFFFKEIDYHQKDDLISLMNYLRDETNLLENREFPNRNIPGQISFDRRDYKLGRGLFVASSSELNFDLLMDILVNIGVGNAVNLICLNSKCHEVWKPIIELVYKVGFSHLNIIDYNLDENQAIEALQDKSIQFVVSENAESLVYFISRNLFESDRVFLVKYVVSGSTIFMRDWDRYFKEYSIARSFAINTMRHGAPLELNL